MALSTYAGLQAAIASWQFNRSDLPTDDIITLAEDRLNTDLRLRVMEAETTLTGVVSSRYIALPSLFLEPLDLWLVLSDVGRVELTPLTPDRMPAWPSNAQPQYWCVDGTNVAFECPVDTTYSFTLRFLQGFRLASTAPADGTQTNWLLTNYPSLYLSACRIESADYLQRPDPAGVAESRYAERLAGVKAQQARSRSIARLRVDPALQPRAMGRQGSFNIYRGS
jgi:hypothetical protein